MTSIRSDWEDQLMVLRGLLASTGALHEAQVMQLKMWGGVAFGAGGWEINVDVDRRVLAYKLKRVPRNLKQTAKLVAGLDRSVHWLLGPEWCLHVLVGKKPLYTGQREVAPGEKTNEQRRARTAIERP